MAFGVQFPTLESFVNLPFQNLLSLRKEKKKETGAHLLLYLTKSVIKRDRISHAKNRRRNTKTVKMKQQFLDSQG